MSKLWVSNISGIGFAITGTIMPAYIELIKPYADYVLAFGISLIISPWVLVLADFFRNKKSSRSKKPTKPCPQEITKQTCKPKHIYLTGKDISDNHDVKPFELKQRVENGMPAYIRISEGYRTDNLRAVSERDLIACEEWPEEEAKGWIEKWLFKTEDIERYINKAVWLTGKEVIDKYSISAIELYQHVKNGLNVYAKDFSAVMLTDKVQPLSEYDIGFEIEYDIAHSDEVYNILKDYHFKVCDIEKYIR